MLSDTMFITTPLIESEPLSRQVGARVLLKLELLQPSGSFKLRGASHACERAHAEGATAVVCASGGNHGLAVAHAARSLGLSATVFLPTASSDALVARFVSLDAAVQRTGRDWYESQLAAERWGQEQGARVIHPFDDEDMIQGHASLVHEIFSACTPNAIVVAVGGGGLLAGVIEGLEQRGALQQTRVLAVETHGADCLGAALDAGHPVALPEVTSIASSLGSRRVGDRCWERAQRARLEHTRVTDAEALEALYALIDDHRLVVEPASSSTVAALLQGAFAVETHETIVVVLCGGANITTQQICQYRAQR